MTGVNKGDAGRPLGGWLKDAGKLAGGAVVSQGILLLALLWLTKLYGPHEFGIWALFLSLTVLLPVIANMRYDIAVAIAKTEQQAAGALLIGALSSLGIALIVLIASLVYAHPVAQMLNEPALSRWLWLLAPYTFCVGVSTPTLQWWARHHQFWNMSAYRIVTNLLTVGVQVVFALAVARTAQGLIIGTVVGQALTAFIGAFVVVSRNWSLFSKGWTLKELWLCAVSFRNVTLYTVPYSIVGNLQVQAVPILLGAWFSIAVVGGYYLAMRVSYNPFSFVSAALSQSFLPRMARAAPNLRPLGEPVSQLLTLLVVIGMPIVLLVCFHTDALVSIAFGEKWRAAVPLLRALFLAYPFMALVLWLERIFDVMGRQRLHLMIAIIMNSVIFATFISAAMITHDPNWSIAMLSASIVVCHLAWLLSAVYIGNLGFRILVKPGIAVAGATVWIVAAEGAAALFASGWPAMAIILVAVAAYYAVALHWCRDSVGELLGRRANANVPVPSPGIVQG